MPFREIDVSRDQAAARELVRRTGQQGVPVIAVGAEYIIGFDRPRLEAALSRLGQQRPADTGPRPRFGAAVADAARHGAGTGALVGRVAPETAASRVGLAAGDVLTGINGRTIQSAADVEEAIQNLTPGAAMSVSYRRGGTEHTASGRL